MTTENPKEHEDNAADERQGGNLETKGASQEQPPRSAEESDSAEAPSGEGTPSSGGAE